MKVYHKLLLGVIFTCACISVKAQILITDFRPVPFLESRPSGQYDPKELYKVGVRGWEAILLPKDVTYQRAPSNNYMNVLKAAFPLAKGWTYAQSQNALSAQSLVVHTYDVFGSFERNRVGAQFSLEYIPHNIDPIAEVHWIQVVTDNHNVTHSDPKLRVHGMRENVVDIALAEGPSPYFDAGGPANSRNFFDQALRNDVDRTHLWDAELFLVTGPEVGKTGPITFYGGVTWGWENHPVPEPSTVWGMFGFVVLLLTNLCRRAYVRRSRV